MAFHVPNQNRVKDGELASTDEVGNNGAFVWQLGPYVFQTIASDEEGWEHVSVTIHSVVPQKMRLPTWREMCYIKNIFWDKEDWVVQFHPAEGDNINNHNFCLHLWRPAEQEFPKPPKEFV